MQGAKPHLLFLITEDWYFRSHRLELARAARDAGMKVSVATLTQDNGKWIKETGGSGKMCWKIVKDNPSRISENQVRAWEREVSLSGGDTGMIRPTVLTSAHVVVVPSYREGLPKILLEACACGRPVIATAVPGCRETVRDGENGFLIPPKEPDTLAKSITVLLKNPALRTDMGSRGREIVAREFSAGQIARETLAVYRELLENSSGT